MEAEYSGMRISGLQQYDSSSNAQTRKRYNYHWNLNPPETASPILDDIQINERHG